MHLLQKFPSALVFDIVQKTIGLHSFFRFHVADTLLKNNIQLTLKHNGDNNLEYIVDDIGDVSIHLSPMEMRLLEVFHQNRGQSLQFCASIAFQKNQNWKKEMAGIRNQYLKNSQWWNLYEKLTQNEQDEISKQIITELEQYQLKLKNNPSLLDELIKEIYGNILFVSEAKRHPKIADLQLALNTIVFPEVTLDTHESTFDFLDLALDILDTD